jgi:hypothetical protein
MKLQHGNQHRLCSKAIKTLNIMAKSENGSVTTFLYREAAETAAGGVRSRSVKKAGVKA